MRTFLICLFTLFIGALPKMAWDQAQTQYVAGDWYFDFNLPDGSIDQQEGLVYYPVSQLQNRVKSTIPRRWTQQWGVVGYASPGCRIQALSPWRIVLLFDGKFTAWTVDGALRFLHRYVLF